MNTAIETMEWTRLMEVAQEYREQGYEVIVRPAETDLPALLSGFQPDMIARKNEEKVVLEVRSRATLANSEELIQLANAVSSLPGWRLDLDVTNPKEMSTPGEDGRELDSEEIISRLDICRRLLSLQQEDAAALLVSSAAEAALRLAAKAKGIELESNEASFILKKMHYLGELSREDYDLLQEGMRHRDLIAHGYKSPKPKPELITQIIGRIDNLLQTHNG